MMTIFPIRFLLILVTLLGHPVASLADVAPDPLSKGMTPTRKESRVQMVSQDVVIHLDREWCLVEADFILRNRSWSPAIMEIGFPTGYKDEVRDLRVWRNSRKVKTKSAVEHEIQELDKEAAVYHWTLWDMRFAPGEKVALRVSYLVKPRKNHDYLITPYRQFLGQIEEEATGASSPEMARVVDGMTSYSTGYIMVTGAEWHGPIADATVTFRHPNGAAAIRWLSPAANFTSFPDGIEYRFVNIDPDFDVEVEFSDQTLAAEIALVRQTMGVMKKSLGLGKHLRYLEEIQTCLAAGNCRPTRSDNQKPIPTTALPR